MQDTPTLSPLPVSCLTVHAPASSKSLSAQSALGASEAKAFNDGFETAFNGGDELSDNPYEYGSDEFCSFNDGFNYWFEHDAEMRQSRALSRHQQLLTELGEDAALARLSRMPIERVGVLIGIPVETWPGKCYEVACALARALNWGTRAAPVYGLFKGRISPDCTLFSGIARHGWIQLQDGRIVDPTRWVFRASAPTIEVFVPGSDAFEQAAEDYDEGAQTLANFTEMPDPDPQQPIHKLPAMMQALLPRITRSLTAPKELALNQLSWLARAAASHMSIQESIEFCDWYIAQQRAGLLPVDLLSKVTRLKQWGPVCFEALNE